MEQIQLRSGQSSTGGIAFFLSWPQYTIVDRAWATLDSRDHSGRSPLYICVDSFLRGEVDAAWLLLENGCNANDKDNDGCSVLVHACL